MRDVRHFVDFQRYWDPTKSLGFSMVLTLFVTWMLSGAPCWKLAPRDRSSKSGTSYHIFMLHHFAIFFYLQKHITTCTPPFFQQFLTIFTLKRWCLKRKHIRHFEKTARHRPLEAQRTWPARSPSPRHGWGLLRKTLRLERGICRYRPAVF